MVGPGLAQAMPLIGFWSTDDEEGESELGDSPALSPALLCNVLFSDVAITSGESHLILKLNSFQQ